MLSTVSLCALASSKCFVPFSWSSSAFTHSPSATKISVKAEFEITLDKSVEVYSTSLFLSAEFMYHARYGKTTNTWTSMLNSSEIRGVISILLDLNGSELPCLSFESPSKLEGGVPNGRLV